MSAAAVIRVASKPEGRSAPFDLPLMSLDTATDLSAVSRVAATVALP